MFIARTRYAWALAIALTAGGAMAETVSRIDAASLSARLQQGAVPYLLDVRTPEEFAEGHIAGAINIPVQQLAQRIGEIPQNVPVVAYCRSGRRVEQALPMLRANGHAVTELQGSMLAWQAAGLPEVKPESITSKSGKRGQ